MLLVVHLILFVHDSARASSISCCTPLLIKCGCHPCWVSGSGKLPNFYFDVYVCTLYQTKTLIMCIMKIILIQAVAIPINLIILRKHLMVCPECQNAINCSLKHYTVKCCDWSVGSNNLVICIAVITFSVLETYAPFKNHACELDLPFNMVMFCILVQRCPIYSATMPSRH